MRIDPFLLGALGIGVGILALQLGGVVPGPIALAFWIGWTTHALWAIGYRIWLNAHP